MTEPAIKRDLRKLRKLIKWSSVLGILFSLVCNSLPVEYRAACHTVISACTAGG